MLDGACADQPHASRCATAASSCATSKVIGADEGGGSFPREVDFTDIGERAGAIDLVVRDTCDAEYGINVFQQPRGRDPRQLRPRLQRRGLLRRRHQPTPAGVLRVVRNEAANNPRDHLRGRDRRPRSGSSDNFLHDNNLPFGEDGPAGGHLLPPQPTATLLRGNRRDRQRRLRRSISTRLRIATACSTTSALGNPGGAFFDEGHRQLRLRQQAEPVPALLSRPGRPGNFAPAGRVGRGGAVTANPQGRRLRSL